MRIGLIGCGRAGVTIFNLLKRNNRIIGVYDIKKENERTAVRILKIKDNPTYKELINQSEALFIATPDDEILNAYDKIRKHARERKYIYHLSGVLPADIMPRRKNISRASVHPFATFPTITAPSRRKRYSISIEGDPPAIRSARAIFHKNNFTLRRINKKDKTIYHLVGVFSSNLLVGLVSSIQKLVNRINWHEEELEQMIFPIIEETVGNLKKYGIQDSLSGPLRRGDLGIIEKHLHALKNEKNLLNIYKALSRSLVADMSDGKRKRALKKILR
jgi:predicted short-subunit dehydrogenase-like oxidoreductase (DUF2520 family)